MILLIIAAIALMLAGFLAYNPLRRKYAGIIGVGGSYIVLLGVMLLISSIGQIIGAITGESRASALEIILGLIVMLLSLGYMVYVMLTRCRTVAQRILLPFVACLIGFGFCWRAGRAEISFLPSSMIRVTTSSGCSAKAAIMPIITVKKPDSGCSSMSRICQTDCPTAGAAVDRPPIHTRKEIIRLMKFFAGEQCGQEENGARHSRQEIRGNESCIGQIKYPLSA